MKRSLNTKRPSPFTRRRVRLSSDAPKQIADYSKMSVLVVNSSNNMAKEITHQLGMALPSCAIIYAPSIELAKLILKRRKMDLVVASSVLADGGVNRLKRVLNEVKDPPDLVIVGDLKVNAAESFESSGYQFAGMKRFNGEVEEEQSSEETQISILGADIRNDLNNPLQEIVAMIFVARASGELNPATEKSLQAIDKAAKNMAEVVWGLEDKIKVAVDP